MNKIKTRFSIRTMLCGLLALSMMSCNDAELSIETLGVQGDPHDPTQPIEITDFSPKEGGAGQQMVIYGKNFEEVNSMLTNEVQILMKRLQHV